MLEDEEVNSAQTHVPLPPAMGDSELSTFMEELRKLQIQMRNTAAQVMENGTDTAIWETRGGLRMLNMITAQVEARVKQLATE